MAGDAVVEDLILAVEAMGLPEAAAAVDTLTGSVDALGASIDRADVAIGGGEAAAAGGGGFMKGLTSMKTLFVALGVGVAIKQFASFQSQMERLRTQAGATQAEVGILSKGILSMAVSVGTGPNSLAEAMYHIRSAGFKGKEGLNALEIAAKGAKIGGAEMTATTTGLTAVLVAGFRGVDTLQKAMGALNATVGAGDMTFEDLNSALSTGILATFKTAGLQVVDLGAALATLGDNNIRGAKAATQLRQAVIGMTGPSKVAQGVLKELGMGPLQLAKDLRKPDGGLAALTDLKKRLDALSPIERGKAVVGIFGARDSGPVNTLLEQLGRLHTKYGEIIAKENSFNADSIATTHTLAFFGDQLKALGEVALIKFGGALNWVIGELYKLSEGLKKGKVWAVAAAAGIVGMTLALGGEAIALGAATIATTAFGVALSIISEIPIVALFAAIVVAIYLLVTHFKQVKAVALDAFHWITQAGKDAFGWIKDHWKLLLAILGGPFTLMVYLVATNFHTVVKAAEWLLSGLSTIFKAVFGVLTWPFRELWNVVKGIAVAIVHAFSWMVEQVGKLLGKILGPLGSVGHFLGSIGGGVGHALGDAGSFLGLANGTPNVTTGGAFVVGERGPEIIYLPRGAAVQPNHELGNSLGGGGNGENVLEATLINVLDGRQVSRSVIRQGLMAQSRSG